MTEHGWKQSVSTSPGTERNASPQGMRPGKRTLTEGLAPVQRKASDGAEAERTSTAPSGGGRQLPAPVRGGVERLFGHDFSAVRVHEGAHATAIGALAYTQGTDVHFAPGRYDPDSKAGRELLGHELTHVVQQREGRAPATTQAKGVALNDDPALEHEADEMGARFAASGTAGATQNESREAAPKADGEVVQAKSDGACPTCGGNSEGGACAACKSTGAGATGVVQRQAGPSGATPAGQGACHGTNRTAGPEHEAIQAHYIATIDPTGVREYAIPGGSESGNIGYADLVSLGTGAIYEIKPYIPTEITAGQTQVAAYLAAARISCNQAIPWHLGITYPDSVIPLAGDVELVTKQYAHPGLILYYRRRKERQRQQVPTTEKVMEVLLALGLSLAMVAVVIAALADPEPATKLALAGLSAVMIVAVLEAFGLKEPDQVPQT